MNLGQNLLMRAFGRPSGLLGRLGGHIMARLNQDCAFWVIGLLKLQPSDKVLEVGFGPGLAIERLAEREPSAAFVAGVDVSCEMVEQAKKRNAEAIARGCVALRQGAAEHLPFDDATFDKAMAVNSMQVWSDAIAGLREIHRVLKPGSRIALGFTPYSGQANRGLSELLTAGGFSQAHVVERERDFCALATKP